MTTTDTRTPIERAEEILAYASMGSETFYRHPLVGGFLYSENVNRMAEAVGAHWLIDAIASHQRNARREIARLGERDFQMWTLTPPSDDPSCPHSGWVLQAWTDHPGHGELLALQEIEYSDFPTELCGERGFRLLVENGTLILPAER